MSGRARAPIGASERPGIFGKPASERMSQSWESGFSPKKESCRNGAQVGVENIEATTRGSLSSGHRRSITSRESEDGSNGSFQSVAPSSEGRLQASGRSGAPGINGRISDEGKENHGDGEDLLELEHIIGYTGHFAQTVIAHPRDSSVIIKAMGSLLVIGAVADPHQQNILRGHDMEISALAVSHSGSLIATGQRGSTRRKGYPAPVILWDFATRTSVHVFEGLSESVQHLSFSTDQRFLLGCGGKNLVYVWDTNTGELVIGKRYTEPATLGQWTSVKEAGRRNVYHICLCIGQDIVASEMKFDPARRQWNLSGGPMSTPSVGLRRRYHCSTLHDEGKFLLCGTDVGDLVVFGVEAKVFRASVPVSSGGVLSVCTDHATGAVFCGGGNGVLRKVSLRQSACAHHGKWGIVGTDMVWQQERETRLDGGIIALSVQADNCELLAGTQQGSVYRLLLADLSASKISSSETSAVLCVACGPRVDTFATCAKDGTVRVWDLCDYAVVTETSECSYGGGGGSSSSALCLSWLGGKAVITGWADSFVRCHDAGTGGLLWEIPRAHRAAVTCCTLRSDSSVAFLVTGSEDGSVNVWELRTRELLLGFSEHQKGVRAVLIDVTQPHLVHSVGEDCTVFTYDLRKERRTNVHMTRAGPFQSMTQRLDSENELITCDIHGRLLTWDCDIREPVQALQDPSNKRLSSVTVSPSGRYLALGGDDETIKVLDLTNNCETVGYGRAHAGAITSVQWTRDERQLLSAAEDCTLAIWNFFGASANPVAECSTDGDRQR